VVVLSLLMAPLAWRAARGRLASLVLAASPGVLAAALLVAVSWSGKAEAQGAVAVLLDSPAGGTADIPYDAALDTPHSDFMSPYVVRNTTGQALRVTGITLTSGHAQRSTMSNPPCAVGTGCAAPARAAAYVMAPTGGCTCAQAVCGQVAVAAAHNHGVKVRGKREGKIIMIPGR